MTSIYVAHVQYVGQFLLSLQLFANNKPEQVQGAKPQYRQFSCFGKYKGLDNVCVFYVGTMNDDILIINIVHCLYTMCNMQHCNTMHCPKDAYTLPTLNA